MAKKITRQDKINRRTTRTPNPKYSPDTYGYRSFKLSETQADLIQKIDESTITFLESPAGCGKTFAALYYAVDQLLVNMYDIVVIRTPVESGSDKIGFLPSDLNVKLEPHFASTRVLLNDLLSPGKVESDLDKNIHFKIPNYCLGCTFNNSTVIIDEAQELSPLTMKLLLERIGLNTKMIICGDPTQQYSHSSQRGGLTSALHRFFKTEASELKRDSEGNLIPLYDKVGYHRFTADDMMRSDIVKTVVTAYSIKPL